MFISKKHHLSKKIRDGVYKDLVRIQEIIKIFQKFILGPTGRVALKNVLIKILSILLLQKM